MLCEVNADDGVERGNVENAVVPSLRCHEEETPGLVGRRLDRRRRRQVQRSRIPDNGDDASRGHIDPPHPMTVTKTKFGLLVL
jgi:hypothetical protein